MARRRKLNINSDLLPGLFDDMIAETAPREDTPQPSTAAPKSRRPTRGGQSAAEDQKAPAAPLPQPKPTAEDGRPSPTLRFMSFGSGSSGNCSYLGDDRFGLLIDAGIEPTQIVDRLLHCGITMDRIGGIILTHDHGDHVRYAYTLVRKFQHMRIYCTPRTLNGILRRHSISRRIKDYHQPIFKEIPFHLGNFMITPFEVFHDGSDNVGFHIAAGDVHFVVATDMGQVSERADYYIRQAHHLMIESNYDLNMLLTGTYPEYLKARIISRTGHMDNALTGAYLSQIATPQLRNVFLCHLSNDNNRPEIALSAIREALTSKGLTVAEVNALTDADIHVSTLPRFESTPLYTLKIN